MGQLFSQRLPNLLGGVSQAPDAHKLPNEFSTMENCIIDPLVGIRKRPGATHVASLRTYASELDNGFFYHINRSETERYVAVVVNGDLKVYNALTGAEQTVYFPHGKSYLAYTAANNWRATTVGDSTFLVNREFTVERDTTVSDDAPIEALVTVWQTGVSQFFSITLDGHTVEVATRSKADGLQSAEMMTQFVVLSLMGKLRDIPEVASKFNVVQHGSVLYISKQDGSNFTIKTLDSFGNAGMTVVKGSVKSLEELPPGAPEGTVLKVVGQPGSGKDDIWVKAEPASKDDRETGTLVIWRETVAPGIQTRIKASTMPHVLERTGYTLPLTVASNNANWPYPFLRQTIASEDKMGWAFDAASVAEDASKTRIVTDNGEGGRTDLTTDYPPTGRAKGTWSWAIDTTLVPTGQTARVVVELLDDVGAVIETKEYEYEAGEVFPNESHEYEFDASLQCRATITLYHDVGEAPGGANYPQLALYGSKYETPGFLMEVYGASQLVVGGYLRDYPSNLYVQLSLNGGSIVNNFTLTSDISAEDMATEIAGKLDGLTAGLTATAIPATRFGEVHVVEVSLDGGPIEDFTGSLSLDAYTVFYNDDLELSSSSLVGMVLTNHTSGATGTVTANSGQTIKVNALSGGTRSYFLPGDEITVSGTGSSTWSFRKVTWADRKVGDIKQSPWPTFVGKKMMDVFFHKGRLGFISENAAVLSAAQDLFRFFRKTVTAVLEDDPIDVKVASKDAIKLESAVEWNSMLVLSTTGGMQYSLTGSPVLSPQSATLEHISSYPSSDYMRPYRFAGSLMFAKEAGGYSQVREMFEGIYGRLENNLLTEKIPRYIPGDIVAMAGDADLGFLACLTNTSANKNHLYIWQFKHGQTGELLVSAWHHWYFNTHSSAILSIDVYAGRLYMLTKAWPDVAATGSPSGSDIKLCLQYVDLTRRPVSGTQVGDNVGGSGGLYTFWSVLVLPVLYRRSAEGVAQTEGRTQVRWLKIDYKDTQGLFILCDPGGPATSRTTSVGTSATTTLASGVLRVPVLCENTQVTSLGVLNNNKCDFTITGIEWEAFFHSRNQRV